MLHFTYEGEEKFNKDELCQGDVLKRTPELEKLLREVHPHFHAKSDYKYFLVLTQSCDLVPRQGGRCKAPYITIAAVRPVVTVLNRQIAVHMNSSIQAALPILTQKSKEKIQEFLRRLFNNNEPGYFYLDSAGTPLEVDCCAILAVSIALKAPEHYTKCVEAKVLQLTDTFQAKLGWLVGQMYSRVGTTDWEPKLVNPKVASLLESSVILIPPHAEEVIEHAFFERAVADGPFSIEEVREIIKKLPKNKRKILERVDAVAKEVLVSSFVGQPIGHIEKAAGRIMRRLDGDAAFTQLTK